MIEEILNEENNSIKEAILAYANNNYSNTKILYFAISKKNHDLSAIGYSYDNFIKCEKYQSEYLFYQTTHFEIKLFTEISNKKIIKKHLYKIAILILLYINNIELDEFLDFLGLTLQEYNDLLDYKKSTVKGLYKSYNRTQILQTLKFNNKKTLDEYLDTDLITPVKLEEIPYE
ncbi:MAG: hypothetical protein R3Y05_02530 [bacterium]